MTADDELRRDLARTIAKSFAEFYDTPYRGETNTDFAIADAILAAFRVSRRNEPEPALMRDDDLRLLLDLFMCADPSPWTPEQDVAFSTLLAREAQARGYEGWSDAYHRHLGAAGESPNPANEG